MILKYYCENEQCSQFWKMVEVPRGKSADCYECGWMLTPAEQQ